jgi:hypothetical protein
VNNKNPNIVCALCIATKDGLSIFIFGKSRIVKYVLAAKAIVNSMYNGVADVVMLENISENVMIASMLVINEIKANLNGAFNNHVANVDVFCICFPFLGVV